ncbi:2-oxo acid dehydrogenase subunit E2 [Mycolicibacterium wolinskyi]|uniref:Dihydrolipoamide acetyltransferase component of pyruvate dehydrogenase complex n=1 Tax=Mycolicibacterium wolinskyi TaxID=59750 RepID=A0A1X2F297_9MYCO|nr:MULTISPECIES: 2-oxo acid dehydrogenase subunit E2 [Mycolicibacterium]MCV7287722.1 2-oxo acid dehydrogenase subunit E2 [Mycolicibacterium wolinskyi]MCV7294620.1 2-oxo acid dehydrogenase subunit E2 [Mycolicibacterium goodii]ORX12505.1 diaminohydroxyphosphoribosylaminopyrimidine deaminase [Mycolicibacterium wolinskyi]
MSDLAVVEIPKWGLSMEEGTVVEWLVTEGTAFTKGDLLCEIETSKITNQLEAPFDGLLRRILAKPGDTLPVSAPIAICAPMSVSDAEVDSFAADLAKTTGVASPAPQPAPAPTATSPVVQSLPVATPVTSPATPAGRATVVPDVLHGTTQGDVFATRHALRLADELSIDLARVTPTGRGGRISVTDVEQAILDAGGTVAAKAPAVRSGIPGRSTRDDRGVAATPVARRLAGKLGVNLHDCRATGSRGRVCEADVRDAARRFSPEPAASPNAPSSTAAVDHETIPLSAMRRAIASRLQESKRNAPHFRLTVDLKIDDLLRLRDEINATVAGVKLSVNDFIVKACAMALVKVPDVNIQYDEQAQSVLRYTSADVSVAVALPAGLITPIVRGADGRSLAQISSEIATLVTKAKAGTLQPDEFQGGTFTVSNLGMFGVRQFDAIINPPQGAILAVGTATERPEIAGGELVSTTIMSVTLSCDHRVIDGATGARFLQQLRAYVESPALMLV